MTAGTPSASNPSFDPGRWGANSDYLRAVELGIGEYLNIPRVIQVPNPAPGVNFSVTVPPGTVWRVKSIRFSFTASGAISTRVFGIAYADGAAEYFRSDMAGTFAAGSTTPACAAPSIGSPALGSGLQLIVLPSPSVPILGAHTIASSGSGLDAGDQFSAIVFYVIQTRIRTPQERANYFRAILDGDNMDPYPGLMIGDV